MNSMEPVTRDHPLTTRIVATIALLALLSACNSGGNDGDQVGFGSGQDRDPVALESPIFYVKRPVPVVEEGEDPVEEDLRVILSFNPGADLFFRDRASPSTPDVDLTSELTQGLADIRDVTVSFDATKVAFAMRYPFDPDVELEDQVATWNIWEFDLETRALRRVIDSDIIAEQGHDISPRFLPDGRLVFSSTRQRQSSAILLDEGKPQFAALDEDRNEPAFLLHTMQLDGTDIQQIGFNQSHELNPAVLNDGRIVFTRWDNVGNNNAFNLYRVNPDGSDLQLLYGANSHDVDNDGQQEQFTLPEALPNGRVLSLLKPFTGADTGGALVEINVADYIENTQASLNNAGGTGPAQTPGTVNDVVVAADQTSPGGRYRSVYPLRDGTGRLLLSWTQCRLQDPLTLRILACTPANLADANLIDAPPLYGIWIYDPEDETQLPVVTPEEGVIFSDIVAAEVRALTPVLLPGLNDFTLDSGLASDGEGVINIRSVYDVLGVDTAPGGIDVVADPAQTDAAARPARFLRLEKAVSIPDEDIVEIPGSAFGAAGGLGMREILGYTMIEPDGSVMVKVPADVALTFSILDARGRRIGGRHDNWLQVRPGELVTCNGCHDGGSGLSHGRNDAFTAAHDGATTTGQPYPNTNPAFFADIGETMAEVRTRISCGTDFCASLEPSMDIFFDDVWTDPAAAGRAPDASYQFRYTELTTLAPTTLACQQNWDATCRSTIHYQDHIHPIWSVPRQTLDALGNVVSDFTCIACHTDRDAAGMLQVPIAQLDLTDGISDQNNDQFKAFRELLFNDNEVELRMGALQDRQVEVGIDPVTMLPILETVTVPSSMTGGSANASGRFFDRFDAAGTHAGYLTQGELRLLAEWLDIGAQYYNDPFVVPQD
ncbi:MAG: hypothetical protein AAGA84_01165 [Pseudomonadota bacterium]